ncbi:MAG: carbon-nitrogen hydrolase family protein [Bacteroidota bacterium]
MKIALAQTKPHKGDILRNIDDHLDFARLASEHGADAIFFSELSLTGYEPELAKDLSTSIDDVRLDRLQKFSTEYQITIGTGLPIQSNDGIHISMVILPPDQTRTVYHKQFLHEDEEPFFVPGQTTNYIDIKGLRIGLAICYEISRPEHVEAAINNGAKLYLASVAKFADGVEQAFPRLKHIATENNMITCMVNSVGPADNGICTGKSCVWSRSGELLINLSSDQEGIVIFDTSSQSSPISLYI